MTNEAPSVFVGCFVICPVVRPSMSGWNRSKSIVSRFLLWSVLVLTFGPVWADGVVPKRSDAVPWYWTSRASGTDLIEVCLREATAYWEPYNQVGSSWVSGN